MDIIEEEEKEEGKISRSSIQIPERKKYLEKNHFSSQKADPLQNVANVTSGSCAQEAK